MRRIITLKYTGTVMGSVQKGNIFFHQRLKTFAPVALRAYVMASATRMFSYRT